MMIGTLETLTDVRLRNGVTVRVLRYHTKYGECSDSNEQSDSDLGCPQVALLVSVWLDEEDASEFHLWRSSSRLWWRLDSEQSKQTQSDRRYELHLLACERSKSAGMGVGGAQAAWRPVPYLLTVQWPDKATLERVGATPANRNCFRD
jgi:hypothetical protein